VSFKYSPTDTDDEVRHVRSIDLFTHTRYLLARKVPVPFRTRVRRRLMRRQDRPSSDVKNEISVVFNGLVPYSVSVMV
jgi:hypothetical protein